MAPLENFSLKMALMRLTGLVASRLRHLGWRGVAWTLAALPISLFLSRQAPEVAPVLIPPDLLPPQPRQSSRVMLPNTNLEG